MENHVEILSQTETPEARESPYWQRDFLRAGQEIATVVGRYSVDPESVLNLKIPEKGKLDEENIARLLGEIKLLDPNLNKAEIRVEQDAFDAWVISMAKLDALKESRKEKELLKKLESFKNMLQLNIGKTIDEIPVPIKRIITFFSLISLASCAPIVAKAQPLILNTPTAIQQNIEVTATPGPVFSPDEYAQMTKTAPLLKPGAYDKAVQATAEAFASTGWKKEVENGFPVEAVNSSVEVDMVAKPFSLVEGSGTLIHIDGYWIVTTAAHVVNQETIKGKPLLGIYLKRDQSLPYPGAAYFTPDQFGIATASDKGIDLAVIVIPDKNVNQKTTNMLDTEMAVTQDQIYFGGKAPDGKYSAMCFPGITKQKPTITYEGRLPIFTNPERSDSTFLVDDSLSEGGCSGGGMFVTIGEKAFYIGTITGIFSQDPRLADNTLVTSVGSMGGVGGFDQLIQSAIANIGSGK